MTDEPNYYALLGVAEDADETAIRTAFRQLARKYHPDVAGTGSLARMQELNVAYQVLSDPEQRREYDLRRGTPVAVAHAEYRSPQPPPPSPSPSAYARAREHAAPKQPRAGSVRVSEGPLRRIARLEVSESTPLVAVAFGVPGVQVGLGLIDGRITIWNVADGRLASTLAFGADSPAGVLQELRLSPSGRFAAAWGFSLGARVWDIGERQVIWRTGASAPRGLMDAALRDDPPLIRLAMPDAPLALADDDPFHWANTGRQSSAILTRPLSGVVDPAWANPLHCREGAGGIFRDGQGGEWRVQQRMLSRDARSLLTLAIEAQPSDQRKHALHVWDLEHRTLLGSPETRRIARVVEPASALRFPFAATPDLSRIIAVSGDRSLRILTPRTRQQHVFAVGAIPDDAQLALSADGSLAALVRTRTLDLYDTRTGKPLQQWECADEISALAFAPESGSSRLCIALRNGLAELWDR